MATLPRFLTVSLLLSCCACSGGGGGGGADVPSVPQLAAAGARAYGVVDLGTGRMSMRSGLGLQGPTIGGMALDPGSGILYGIESLGGILLRIDPQTAEFEVVGGTGFDFVRNLAFDTKRGRLTAVVYPDNVTGHGTMLIAIDPLTGVGFPLGDFPGGPFPDVDGLTYDPDSDRLYGIRSNDLWRIHPATAAAEKIGEVSVSFCRDIEIDPATGLLWSSCQGLYQIDPITATATFVASFDPFMSSAELAFDPTTGSLYAADGNRHKLVQVNQLSGKTTAIGSYGFSILGGLEYDEETERLYGTEISTAELVSIDPKTGVGTVVGKIDSGQVRGLAMDQAAGLLYGSDWSGDVLHEIEPASAASKSLGPIGFDQVAGLAFDPLSNTLYGVDDKSDSLIVVDPVTGNGSAVGTLGFDAVVSLAFDHVNGVLYGVDNEEFVLLEIDPGSGAAQAIQFPTPGFKYSHGLAFEPKSGHLFSSSGQLERIDPSTGEVTSVGETISYIQGLALDETTGTLYSTSGGSLFRVNPADGVSTSFGYTTLELTGLAFDPNSGTLYGSDISAGLLARIDTVSGSTIELGLLGFDFVRGLAFDPIAGVLYGSDTETDQLIRINTLTGVGTAIGALGFEFVEALEFDVESNTLYGADGKTRQLLSIDVSTGAATAIGSTGHRVRGLAGRVP